MRFILILIAILALQNHSRGQDYYIPLDNVSGIIMAPEQETELETAIAQIVALLDSAHQPRFKVYDFGYYLHNEPMGIVPDMWTTVVANVENDPNSDYYLIFGRESSSEGMNNRVRVNLKLPEDLGFECMTADMRTNIEKYVEVAANETGSLAVFADELAAVKILHEYVYKILVCGCNGLSKPIGCSTTKSFAQIDIELRALGFRKKEITLGGASGWPSGQNGIFDYAQKNVVIDGSEYNIADQVSESKSILEATEQVLPDTTISTSVSGEVHILDNESFSNGEWETALQNATEFDYIEYWVILTDDFGQSFLYSRYTLGGIAQSSGVAKYDSLSGKLVAGLSPLGILLEFVGNAALDVLMQCLVNYILTGLDWQAAWDEVSVRGALWEGLTSLLPWKNDVLSGIARTAWSAFGVVLDHSSKDPNYTLEHGIRDFIVGFASSAFSQFITWKVGGWNWGIAKGVAKIGSWASGKNYGKLTGIIKNVWNGFQKATHSAGSYSGLPSFIRAVIGNTGFIHIFRGEIKSKLQNGVTVYFCQGMHHISAVVAGQVKIIPHTVKEVVGMPGCYQADVEIFHAATNTWLKKWSTFFPDHWSEEKILRELKDVMDNKYGHLYGNSSRDNSGAITGYMSNGYRVKVVLEKTTGQIKTAFPLP